MAQRVSAISNITKALKITSKAFENGAHIPSKYTCDGENINPPLSIAGLPNETISIVIIVEDCDTNPNCWIHWLVWNLSPVKEIQEDCKSGVQGKNDFGKYNYGGPCPPTGIHTYVFNIYALNSMLELKPNATKLILESQMQPHIIAFGKISGTYQRN